MKTDTAPTLSMRHVVDLPLAPTFARLNITTQAIKPLDRAPDQIYLTPRRRIRIAWRLDVQGKPHIRWLELNPICLLAAMEQIWAVRLLNPVYPLASIRRSADTLRLEFIREASSYLPGRPIALRPALRRILWDIISASAAPEDPLWYVNAWPWRYLGRVHDQVTDLAWELPGAIDATSTTRIHLQLFHLPIVVARMLPGMITQTFSRVLDVFVHADPAHRVIFWALGRVA